MEARAATGLSLVALALSVAALVRSGGGPAKPAVAPPVERVAVVENAEGAAVENAEGAVAAENAEGAVATGTHGAEGQEVGATGARESPAPIMSRLSAHFAAAWYAAKAGNAPLLEYELHEMEEAVASLEGRRLRGVELGAMAHKRLDNNVGNMRRAVEQGDWDNFDRAYHTTIDACNTCHRDNGVPFIQIVVPDQPPMGNRRWAPGS